MDGYPYVTLLLLDKLIYSHFYLLFLLNWSVKH